MNKKPWFLAVALILITLLTFSVYANQSGEVTAEGSSFDVVFVIDNSESMLESDPQRFSFTAIQLFADLCAKTNSRIGYVGFSDKLKHKLPMQQISANTDFCSMLNELDNFGGGTNISFGLSEAYNLFNSTNKSEYNNRRAVILLVDGNNQPTAFSTAAKLDTVTQAEAQRIKDAGIALYTIGLNYNGELNTDFMKTLPSDESKFFEAKTAAELTGIIGRIYMNLFNGSSIHLGDYTSSGIKQKIGVTLSRDMYEADIVFISSEPISSITVFKPDGTALNTASAYKSLKYSFIRLNFPESGKWTVEFTGASGDTVFADLISIYDIPDFAYVSITFESDCNTAVYPQNVRYGSVANPPAAPIKPGYIFKGWYTDAECTDLYTFSDAVKYDITLYAGWSIEQAKDLTVSFEMNGGKPVSPVSVTAGNTVTPPTESFIRYGYNFGGFFLDKNLTIPFDGSETINSDTVLYAKWILIEANITPVIIFGCIAVVVLLLAVILYPKIISGKRGLGLTPFVSSIFAVPVIGLICITAYALFKSLLIPEVFHFTEVSRQVFGLEFSVIYFQFVLITGVILPAALNLLLVYIIPCFTGGMRRYRKKQFYKHLIFSVTGMIFPLALALSFGVDIKSMIYLLGFYFITYPLNYILSSLTVSTTMSSAFSFWG